MQCTLGKSVNHFDDWMVHIKVQSIQGYQTCIVTLWLWIYRQEDTNLSEHFLTDDKNFPHANKVASSALLLHFAFISLLSPPPPSRKWRLSKLMMDAVLLKMQLLKYFDSSYFVEVGLKLHESQLHHFFQCKSSTRKKIACSTCTYESGWREAPKRPPKLHYRFCTKQHGKCWHVAT